MNILYEDNEIIVVYKEAGLAVQARSALQMDLESMLRRHLAAAGMPPAELYVVHRKDEGSCGRPHTPAHGRPDEKNLQSPRRGEYPERGGYSGGLSRERFRQCDSRSTKAENTAKGQESSSESGSPL